MSKIDYTLWPNPDGNLGNNKVEIPDGVTTKWPAGDALVGNFIYNEGKLVGFVDTKALINNTSKTSTINYDFVEMHLENFSEGDITFNLGERTKYFNVTYGSTFAEEVFKYKGCTTVDEVKAVDSDYLTNDIVSGVWAEDLSDLTNGFRMFQGCSALTSFNSDLSSVTNSNYMFQGCSALTTFNSNLSSLSETFQMFSECTNLTTFNADLSSLRDGSYFFNACTSLSSWTDDLDSLYRGYGMFYRCTALTTVACYLGTLTSGEYMFSGCTNLKNFYGNLASLAIAQGMFEGCKLDT